MLLLKPGRAADSCLSKHLLQAVALIEALTSIAHSRHLQTKVQAMGVAEAIPAADRTRHMSTKLKC